MALSVFEIN